MIFRGQSSPGQTNFNAELRTLKYSQNVNVLASNFLLPMNHPHLLEKLERRHQRNHNNEIVQISVFIYLSIYFIPITQNFKIITSKKFPITIKHQRRREGKPRK